MMKSIINIFTIIILAFSTCVYSQCNVSISPNPITINCGSFVELTAIGMAGSPVLSTSFDSGSIGAGWASSSTVLYTNPCGPTLDGTPSAWFGDVPFPRTLTTNGFDVSCGGQVCFDFDYGDDNPCGGCDDCDDPDLIDEGVYFQYSIDGGASWVDIFYFQPTNNSTGPYYNWANYCYSIPAAAWTTNTMFQWTQPNATNTEFDHWGLDNVEIIPNDCGYYYDWHNVSGTNNPNSQLVSPLTDTYYTVTYTDGIHSCIDSVEVIVQELQIDAITSMNNINCNDCANLDVVLVNNNAGSIIDDFDPDLDMTMWDIIESGTVGGGCGSVSGNALYFDGTGAERHATTAAVNTTNCGVMSFSLFMGNSSTFAPCGNSGIGEDIVFEYSTDGGLTYTVISTYLQSLWDANNNWQTMAVFLPPPAQTLSTKFRWRQTSFTSCVGCDNWSLDNVSFICAPPPYDYSWTPSYGLSDTLIQNPVACPFVTTNYVASIVDPASGCSATDSVLIDVSCDCTFTNLTANLSDCENGNSYSISGDISYIENPVTGTLIIEATNSSGTYSQTLNPPFVDDNLYNYTISGIVSDGSPVVITAYFSDEITCSINTNDVSPVLPEVISISGGGIYCLGDSINDIMVQVNGNGPFTIDYTLDGIPQSYTDNDTLLNLGSIPGVYNITSIADSGCVNIAFGVDSIITQTLPTVSNVYGGDSYCIGDSINDIFADVTGTGPWNLDYTVDGVLYSISSSSSTISLGNIEGQYIMSSITDQACSNVSVGSSSIIINPLPIVDAGVDYTICIGDSTALNASGAQNYVWNHGIIDDILFAPLATETYTVTGTDDNGCVDTSEVTIYVEPLPDPSFVADYLQGCVPSEVTFTNTTSGILQDCIWNFGEGAIVGSCDSINYVFHSSGLHDITLTTSSVNGCTNSVTYDDYIYIENNPVASFTASSYSLLSLNTEVEFTNSSLGADNYLWDFGDNTDNISDINPIHTFPNNESESFLVTLYAYSPIGCVDSVSQVISIIQEIIFYIPNTFTPNGDEFNQAFKPIFTAGIDASDFELYIRNRWGQTIFESRNINVGWDGTYNGKIVQPGTYIWHLKFKDRLNGARYNHSGHLNLIR